VKTAKVDAHRRLYIPTLKPGKMFAWEDNGQGQITLLEVKPVARRKADRRPFKVEPLPADVLDRLYEERQEDDEGTQLLMNAQAWE
jgi:hypothetical protein